MLVIELLKKLTLRKSVYFLVSIIKMSSVLELVTYLNDKQVIQVDYYKKKNSISSN